MDSETPHELGGFIWFQEVFSVQSIGRRFSIANAN